ncbi:alpha/beta fold hydrolase [Cryobacterium sp. M15]|uniref:alpha/beta fold hydrolase n=1 Tax=Cryobacterium sp. M15 TaxID=2048291 RepID=UPI000CE54B5F|nr:alpha/beta hydrolase [Cryobacterium sp. M15]
MSFNDALSNLGGTVLPTIVCVPCFSGAPWDLAALPGLVGLPARTMRLPEDVADVENYATALAEQVHGLTSYVLVGDSFGAVISLALAARQPAGLVGLVLSGGFAANPLPRWKGIAAKLSRFANGAVYRHGTLRFHAFQLASHFDAEAEVPHTQNDYRDLFVQNTPRSSYTARVTSITRFNMINDLARVDVPTLVLTPADDRLVGAEAARQLLDGIRDSSEIVLPKTGHMFRFTHPTLYSNAIRTFVDSVQGVRDSAEFGAS